MVDALCRFESRRVAEGVRLQKRGKCGNRGGCSVSWNSEDESSNLGIHDRDGFMVARSGERITFMAKAIGEAALCVACLQACSGGMHGNKDSIAENVDPHRAPAVKIPVAGVKELSEPEHDTMNTYIILSTARRP